MISKSSYIDPNAKIGKDVQIGINSIIGGNVTIGDGSKIMNNVIIEGNTTIGKNNQIFPFACIGTAPQDLKYKGEKNQIIIGDKNIIREYVTINPGTEQGGKITNIGNNNLFMISSHIAHDCIVGDNVIIANNVPVAGHCFIDNDVIIGGNSAVQQFCCIGKGAMVGGMTGVNKSILPHTLVTGNRCIYENLNLVGLKRKGYENSIIYEYKELLENFFEDRSVIENMHDTSNQLINDFKFFLGKNKNKQICYPYQK